MKLNRKKLNIILPQIKAYLNIAVMMDNPEYPGLIDFLFQPKSTEIEHGYLNKLTCSMGGKDDLFSDTLVESLGKPIVVNIAHFRKVLKCGESDPELKDGMVNGINIQVDPDDLKTAGMRKIIEDTWKNIKGFKFSESVKFAMPRIDYELMVSTMSRFVSHDITRYFMCGYDVDFGQGEDFINFVATDGRRMALCKFPCKHPKMGDSEEQRGDFIINPLQLFIPESTYSLTQWLINEYTSLIRIKTEDYSIDCWARLIDGQFPNYLRVIPDREQSKEWMSLNARSVRNAFVSIKGLIDSNKYSLAKRPVFFNAEDPKHIKLMVSGASVDIEGEASRSMCLRINWDYMEPAFFDTPYTKFLFQNVCKAILAEESRAVRGTTMTITKIVMPMGHEDNVDEWGVNLDKVQTAGNNSESAEEFDSDDEDDSSTIEYGNSLDGDA
jgi:DNA polymerase III sliding clamp (beta) subunit (PCNA family)